MISGILTLGMGWGENLIPTLGYRPAPAPQIPHPFTDRLSTIITLGLGNIHDLIATLGYSEGGTQPPPPPPIVETPPRPSGGVPGDRGPSKEQTRRSRILFGIEQEVIESVAQRQVEHTGLDEQQKLDELRGELQLRDIALESRHIHALSEERERRIDLEIAHLFRLKREEDDMAVLKLLAVSYFGGTGEEIPQELALLLLAGL